MRWPSQRATFMASMMVSTACAAFTRGTSVISATRSTMSDLIIAAPKRGESNNRSQEVSTKGNSGAEAGSFGLAALAGDDAAFHGGGGGAVELLEQRQRDRAAGGAV